SGAPALPADGRRPRYPALCLDKLGVSGVSERDREAGMGRVSFLLLALCVLVFVCGVGAQPLGAALQRTVPSEADADGENAPADEQDGGGTTEPLLALCAAPSWPNAPRSFRVSAVPVRAVWRPRPAPASMLLSGRVTPLRC